VSTLLQHFSAHTRPNWAEIDLEALRRNRRAICDHLKDGITPCYVVKCDAYGHGVVPCAQALEADGAEWLGVTSTEEGVALRMEGVNTRVLIMTGFWRGEEEAVVQHELTPAVATAEHIDALERAALLLNREPKSVAVHLKIDTGMSRFGVSLAELPKLAQRIASAQYVRLEGIFSHMASAEVLDAEDARRQVERFDGAIETLRKLGIEPRYQHLANSAAIQARPAAWHNMVRPGLTLYGYAAEFPGHPEAAIEVAPVLSWKTRIVGLREVPAGTPVGYNGRTVTARATRIGLIAAGYGDGLTRHLSTRGRVIVRGAYAPILGNVSMDMTTVDVTEIPGIAIGDEVTLIGRDGEAFIPATEHANFAGTIPYEILCGISPRVPRIYIG
jgi:alanine racemase